MLNLRGYIVLSYYHVSHIVEKIHKPAVFYILFYNPSNLSIKVGSSHKSQKDHRVSNFHVPQEARARQKNANQFKWSAAVTISVPPAQVPIEHAHLYEQVTMKVGDTVVLLGLVKAKHLNGLLATILRKHDEDRWIVQLENIGGDQGVIFRFCTNSLPD